MPSKSWFFICFLAWKWFHLLPAFTPFVSKVKLRISKLITKLFVLFYITLQKDWSKERQQNHWAIHEQLQYIVSTGVNDANDQNKAEILFAMIQRFNSVPTILMLEKDSDLLLFLTLVSFQTKSCLCCNYFTIFNYEPKSTKVHAYI